MTPVVVLIRYKLWSTLQPYKMLVTGCISTPTVLNWVPPVNVAWKVAAPLAVLTV